MACFCNLPPISSSTNSIFLSGTISTIIVSAFPTMINYNYISTQCTGGWAVFLYTTATKTESLFFNLSFCHKLHYFGNYEWNRRAQYRRIVIIVGFLQSVLLKLHKIVQTINIFNVYVQTQYNMHMYIFYSIIPTIYTK